MVGHIFLIFRARKFVMNGETLTKPGNSEAMKEKMDIFDCTNSQVLGVTKDTINKANSNNGAGKIFAI